MSQPAPQAPEADSISGSALSDGATCVDSLGFTPYVEAIARFLTADATRPPLTISIEGEWGSGKSSFLLQLENAIGAGRSRRPLSERLPEWLGGLKPSDRPAPKPKALSVRFNAWRHDKQDALWAAFALAFVKALRTEVGTLRAWRGDILLFLKRLNGLAAWFELGLILLSALALVFGAFEAWRLVTLHPAETRQLLDWLVTIKPEDKTKPSLVPAGAPLLLAASTGTAGMIAAVGLAGLLKFGAFIKLPLSWKLEKYISKPDYQGHVSFIETFHLDLNRLIEAYAGERRVFIFIDDLDRCDVPRAADLMQAINLMIGDSRNLVFVIGMDREKVAAGIAQKYKDILPFLRDSAHWKPNDEKDNYTPLYFGYGYLEKFIQISFSLPVAADEAALQSFFRDTTPAARAPGWRGRLGAYWSGRLAPPKASEPPATTDDAVYAPTPATPIAPTPTAAAAAKREYYRLQVVQDSARIRDIVKVVGGLFEYNPRRIKQFINTFRLALYIASDLGLFDKEGTREPDATPEQIGKFVALLLRFPDLRFKLEEDPKLLGKLQEAALTKDAPLSVTPAYHWLDKPGGTELLTHGCKPDVTGGRYSLARFDISRLFSVLPRAARPPETANIDISAFAGLAVRYETLRENLPAGQARTRVMTDLAEQARTLAMALSPPTAAATADLLATEATDGRRLMRILIASAHADSANLPWLLGYNASFASAFEHYWCIRTLIDHEPLMSVADRAQVSADLNTRWKTIIADPGRARLAQLLLDMTSAPTLEPTKAPPPRGKTKSPTVKAAPPKAPARKDPPSSSSKTPPSSKTTSAPRKAPARKQAATPQAEDFKRGPEPPA